MRLTFIFLFIATALSVAGQKRLSEGSLSFSVINLVQDHQQGDSLTAQHFFKGAHTRTDLISPTGKTSTLYDSREQLGAVIREFGGQRILIPLDAMAWADKNAWYTADSLNYIDGQQTLLNYTCKQAQIKLRNGAILLVWFTTEIVLDNKDTEFQMEDLPGLVLAYEYQNGNTKVKYTITSLNFDPVPIQKFDIPTSGYRVLSYAESKKQ